MANSKPKLEGLGTQLVVWRSKPRNAQQIDEVRWEFRRRRAGRFRLREIINFLSKNTEKDRKWWGDALVEAIDRGSVPLRNPRNFSDAKPHIAPGRPVPSTLRADYDCVDVDDVNRWLDAHPDWRETWRFDTYLRDHAKRIAHNERDAAERRANGLHQIIDVSELLDQTAGASKWEIREGLRKAIQSGELLTYRRGEWMPYAPGPKTRDHYLSLECRWNDINHWLIRDGRQSPVCFLGPFQSNAETFQRDAAGGATGDAKAAQTANEPTPIPTPIIATTFDGLRWTEEEWAKKLSDGRLKWVQQARVTRGRKGADSATWNPVALALYLRDNSISWHKLDVIFKKAALRKWRERWERDTEQMRD